MAQLLSVNIGMPADIDWNGRTVHTGIWKSSVAGAHMVRRLNIDGDGQGDTAGHGGENRAVLVYQIQSYQYWREQLSRNDLSYGEFGENLTVDGLADDDVCIGDRYRIGGAEFEVTQPRVTCFRVGIRLGQPDMPSLLVSHHRPGFYMRVITEGRIEASDDIVKTRTGPGRLSVAAIDALLYLPDRDIETLRLALSIPALSPGWQVSFRDLLDAAERGDSSATPPVGIEPGWAGFRSLRVTDLVAESDTIMSIYLEQTDGGPLPAAQAGQYLTVRVPTESGVAVRNYSLSSAPGAARYRVTVKHEPDGLVSGYLHDMLRTGATIDTAAPRGDFILAAGSRPVLLISAGVGVTPVLAMLHQLVAVESDRDIWWIHAARRPADQALAAEARDLLARLAHARVRIFLSAADADEARRAHAMAQRLTPEAVAALGVPADAIAYICGPAGFMTSVGDALVAAGIDASDIHAELFGARTSINPGLIGTKPAVPHPPATGPGTGPIITFARSGLSVPFDSTYRSILDLADACDVPTRWSCRTGVCHTCVTPLVSGDITYSPDPLEPPAPGDVLVCCAQPTSDVVVDL